MHVSLMSSAGSSSFALLCPRRWLCQPPLAAAFLLIAGVLGWTGLARPAGALAASPDTPPVAQGLESQGVELRGVVSIPPLRALLEPLLGAIAPGGQASVDVIIPPGVSEHAFEIPPSKLASVTRADVLVYVGLGLEPRITELVQGRERPGREVVEFARSVGIEAEDHAHHHHDEHGNCVHDGVDPHVWLDPALVEQVVPVLRGAVERAATAKAGGTLSATLRARLDNAERNLLARVRSVHEEYAARLETFRGGEIVVAHDAWGRLGARYGITTTAIKGLTATEPTPSSIQNAVNAIRERGVKVVFSEPQLSTRSSQRVADAAGATLMQIDPLGGGDWFSTMRANLDNIVVALERQAQASASAAGKAPAPAPSR